LREALVQARQYGDRETESDILIQFGNIYIEQMKLDEATSVLEDALDIARQVGSQDLIAHALFRSATIEDLRGNKAKARQVAQESLDIFESINHKMAPVVGKWLEELS
jgi:Tfp pilus assembly protein PilF